MLMLLLKNQLYDNIIEIKKRCSYTVEVKRQRLDDRKQIGVSSRIAKNINTKSSKEIVEKARKDPHKASRMYVFSTDGILKLILPAVV